MAVTDVKLSSQGASGAAAGEDPSQITLNYSSNYRVTCNDPLDTATQVLAYFQQNSAYPWMGRLFRFANGFDGNVLCNRVNAEYVEGSSGRFIVTCTFQSPNSNQQQGGGGPGSPGMDINGNATSDPYLFYDEIEISYANITDAAEGGIFRQFINGKGNAFFKPDEPRAITNSAGIAFDPPAERENSIEVIRITRNQAVPNPNKAYRNMVNADAFGISKPLYNFNRSFGPYVGKITAVDSVFGIQNKQRYYRNTTELQIHPRTWRRQFLDQGIMRRVTDGDKDDAGNTISASDTSVAGYVHYRPIKDPDGSFITTPVPLDGDGQPLAPGKPHVFIEYSVDYEVPFSNIVW